MKVKLDLCQFYITLYANVSHDYPGYKYTLKTKELIVLITVEILI